MTTNSSKEERKEMDGELQGRGPAMESVRSIPSNTTHKGAATGGEPSPPTEQIISHLEEMRQPKQEALTKASEKSKLLAMAYARNPDSKEAYEAVRYDESSQGVNVTWGRNEGFVTAIDEIITYLKSLK
jgi:hypothetical protein